MSEAKQLNLFDNGNVQKFNVTEYLLDSFSSDSFCDDTQRKLLEKKYGKLLLVTDSNNRQSVSFQLNKNNGVYGWFKYKEGFSPSLVKGFIKEFNINPGDTILDPFVGSGTTSLAGSELNIHTIGIDILPTSKVAVTAKSNIKKYNIEELRKLVSELKTLRRPAGFKKRVNSVKITKFAYPDETDFDLQFLSEWMQNNKDYSPQALLLLQLAILNSLESLSYTSKDGQYLRWDSRSKKVIATNEKRKQRGKDPIKSSLHKGELPKAFPYIANQLQIMINDIESIHTNEPNKAKSDYIDGSILEVLPKLDSSSIDAVITSPPYLNRYDYSRTYALELAFLGLDEMNFKQLRQMLLSSTVENKSKIEWLEEIYISANRKNDFDFILNVIKSDKVLNEINTALDKREKNGDLNNSGVKRMVKGYFEETSFIMFEMFRLLKSGSYYCTVNDNVRYGGEVIPVDFISTHIAEEFGFKPIKIETIKQQKGNSSQQMKKFGRVALRKSITIWQKP